jgi:hypothetical protein
MMSHKYVIFGRMAGIWAILVPLLLAALACNFQVKQDDGLRQTDIAVGIQQTQLAQTASALVAEGSKSTQAVLYVTATVGPPATPGSQPVAENPTAALPPATAAPSDTPTASTNTPTSQEDIVLTDWRLNFFLPVNSGCKVPDSGCWRMNDDFKKHSGSQLSLVSKVPVKIDPSWPSPYLVFWHKYKFENKAHIDISGDSVWSTIKVLDKQKSSNWKKDAISLEMFKGKEVLVNFAAYGIWGSGGIPGSDWYINDVRIVPNYTP